MDQLPDKLPKENVTELSLGGIPNSLLRCLPLSRVHCTASKILLVSYNRHRCKGIKTKINLCQQHLQSFDEDRSTKSNEALQVLRPIIFSCILVLIAQEFKIRFDWNWYRASWKLLFETLICALSSNAAENTCAVILGPATFFHQPM